MALDRLNPPWGPARDPHFEPTHNHEASGHHEQATPEDAAQRGWFYRPEWYKRLIPDTRRCRIHGEIMFDDDLTSFPLSPESDPYRFQDSGQASGL